MSITMMRNVTRLTMIIALIFSINISGQIKINEFMAKNVSSTPDIIDFDDFSDWIELYNSENSTVDLSNYFLTDNFSNQLKWEIPAGTTIAPNSYLIVWADGYDSDIGKSYMRDYWPWDNFTTQKLHTNFKLSSNGEEIALYKVNNAADSIVITKNDSWKYLDNGSDQGSTWKERAFDDLNWKEGLGTFGYGNGTENTTIGYGPNSSNKYITTYFRKQFNLNNVTDIISLNVELMRDDGAVVYLNGNEIIRSNMASGSILYNTTANSVVGGSEESQYFSYNVDKKFLLDGSNTIAVELHQISSTSSDISFDLELTIKRNRLGNVPQLIDSVSFGHQFSDVSFGRIYNSNSWGYLSEVTPGYSNSGIEITDLTSSPRVNFSITSGFYNGSQQLELSATEGDIKYTLDGSKPDENSTLYSGAISISQNTIVRARTFSTNKIPGPIESNSYFIDEQISELPTASLIVDSTLFWDDQIGIYKNELKHKEVPISLEYFANGNKQFDINAGVKIGGFNIWRFDQKPLNISLDGDYGISSLLYKLFESKPIANFTSFEFRNGGDNWATTLLQDAMAESIIDNHLLNGFQAYRPVVLYINGKYWGIHNLRERFDPAYYHENFGAVLNEYEQLRTDLFPPDNHLGLREVHGSSSDYLAMVDFAKNHNMNDSANYSYIKSLMNTESFIDCIVGEIYVCNTSWRHNREWWRPLTGDKKWQWLLPDIDRGFNINNTNKNLIKDFVNEYDLFKYLLNNANFKNRFIQKFSAHLNSTFAYNRLSEIIDSLSGAIRNEMPNHIARWKSYGGIKSMPIWENELSKMKEFSLNRNDVVYNNINSEFSLSGTSKIKINISNPKAGKIYLNDVLLSESLNDIRVFNNVPFTLTAIPNTGYNFESWESLGNNKTIELVVNRDSTVSVLFNTNSGNVISNNVSTDLTLTSDGSPYIVEGILTVEPNISLTINAGVQLWMGSKSQIEVKGSLNIKGTSDNPVIIKPNETTGTKNWSSIYFNNATDTSHIKYVYINGANYSYNPIEQPAAITSINSDIVIDYLEISNVDFPIFVNGGSVELTNSKLKSNSTCDYINVKRGNATVKNNYFYGNEYSDTDAIDYDGVVNGIIANNKIMNFTGSNSDGIDIGEGTVGLKIYNNKIYNSKDKGISVGQKSDVHVYNNLIVDCNFGVGVKDSSFVLLQNNTFYGNYIAVNSFEKNYKHGGGDVVVQNCILSESKFASTNVDGLSKLQIDYSLSDTDILNGIGNLFSNPKFVDRYNYNFELADSSICIDNGDPQIKDNDGSNSDIGYKYKYTSEDIPDSLRKSLYSRIVINEIMYNDSKGIGSDDWFELFNQTDNAIDLSAWKISDEDSLHVFRIPQNVVLNAKEYIVICKDSLAFKSSYPNVKNILGNMDFGLGGNDKIVITNNSGKIESFVDYDNSGLWPKEPDGSGKTLELISDEMQNYTVLNWAVSSLTGGTPGYKNEPITSIEHEPSLPNRFVLEQNYPNPFNPSTVIKYSIHEKSFVNISVFNVLGQRVLTPVNETKNQGSYSITINAQNLASGIYIYTLKTNTNFSAKKMILLK